MINVERLTIFRYGQRAGVPSKRDSPPTGIRREREPTPRGCRAPSAGPMVRILFPPAKSRANSGTSLNGPISGFPWCDLLQTEADADADGTTEDGKRGEVERSYRRRRCTRRGPDTRAKSRPLPVGRQKLGEGG